MKWTFVMGSFFGSFPAAFSSSIRAATALQRFVACRRKMMPRMGKQYSLEVSFEFARSWSAASHSVSSSF